MPKKRKSQPQPSPTPATVIPAAKTAVPDTWTSRSIVATFIVVATFFVFSPTVHNELLQWDDGVYITDNALIRDLSAAGVQAMFTTPYGGNLR
jgi:hypothetical protein